MRLLRQRGDKTVNAQRQMLRERHALGIELMDGAPDDPQFALPDTDALPTGDALPELTPAELSAGVLRAAILRDGCALVRGLIPRSAAHDLAAEIDRAFAERTAGGNGGYYEPFEPDGRFGPIEGREWIEAGGGVLAVDSPRCCATLLKFFDRAGVPELVVTYLGEPAALSAHKTTLRKADPSVSGAWHQDGSFMGPVRSLNLWLSLSRCGDQAPGLDIVPRRLDYLPTGTEGAKLASAISDDVVAGAADGAGVIRPVFEPGDALLFDELFVHKTGSDPSMPNPRFAVESWFFGGSAFPADYAPIAV